MSTSFSANQYENSFKSNKLGNWEEPSEYREQPRPMDGFTKIIASDRGHLMSGVPRSRSNPWGNYVGTWDIPEKIPGNTAGVTTARTTYAQEKLRKDADKANKVLSGDIKNTSRRLMRDGSTMMTQTRPCDPEAADRNGSDPRSGAEAPGSKMFPYSYSPVPAPIPRRSITPLQAATPDFGHQQQVTSPIPGVPDLPEVFAQASREATPDQQMLVHGLSAL